MHFRTPPAGLFHLEAEMSKKSPQRSTSQTQRHPYSIRFREEYGRSLTRNEIGLVQAFRGLTTKSADVLLQCASALVLRDVQAGARNGGAR